MSLQHKFENISSVMELTSGISSNRMSWVDLFKKIINMVAPERTPDAEIDIMKADNKIIKLQQDEIAYDYGEILFSIADINSKKYFIRCVIFNDYIFFDYDDISIFETYVDHVHSLCIDNFSGLEDVLAQFIPKEQEKLNKFEFCTRFMLHHVIYLFRKYCQATPFDKLTYSILCSNKSLRSDYVDFQPRFLSNNFTLDQNGLTIIDLMDMQPLMANPSLKSKFFGDDEISLNEISFDEISFNDFIMFIITTYIPESICMSCLRNQIPNISLLDISRDHDIVDIYFYDGNFDNNKLLELYTDKQLVYTSSISVPKRYLLKYSKTYDTFVTNEKFLEKVWFINIACNQYVADNILDTIKTEGIWTKDNKFINACSVKELIDYLQILNFMGIQSNK